MNRRKRRIGIALLLLLVLIGPLFWITYRECRQARLDFALIEAIKVGDNRMALTALAAGANGEARDTGKPPTFKAALLHIPDHFRHVPQKDNEHLLALGVLYHQARVKSAKDHRWGSGPDPAIVRALLDHGAKVNEPIEDGSGPLIFACLFSNRDTVRLLLERGADPNLADRSGDFPIMYANAEETKCLLKYQAKIQVVDCSKTTPLMFAAGAGDLNKVGILLEQGAKVEAKDIWGRTALRYAVNDFEPGGRKVEALLLKGLTYLISADLSDYPCALLETEVPLTDRLRCINSMAILFERYFAPRCSPHLSHLVRGTPPEGLNPLNGTCYMWWEILPLHGLIKHRPEHPDAALLDQAILTVVRRIQTLDSIACQESALFGLFLCSIYYPEVNQDMTIS